MKIESILAGGDLRSLGKVNGLIKKIKTQDSFDELFNCLFHSDKVIVMRAADAIEKLTITFPSFLQKHKKKFLELCQSAEQKELKWHLALLYPRFKLSANEFGVAWDTLTRWAMDRSNSRIVRVHALQALFELLKKEKQLKQDFELTLRELETEKIPSLDARIRKLRKMTPGPSRG